MPLKKNALLLDRPHRRFNALRGEWVLVSPHRTRRPWSGHIEPNPVGARHPYDPECYLCPGNKRANGERNPEYTSTHVFTNDFAALLPETERQDATRHPLLRAQLQAGTCRVVCFSPRHDLTLAQMSTTQIRSVVDIWTEQITDLGRHWRWVQIFENKGELMGCSNPHPHGQIWASDFLPDEPAKELVSQQRYFETSQTPLLVDYAALELNSKERLVCENAHWLAVVPWWAVWPFETLLLPRRHVLRLPDLTIPERDTLAEILRRLLATYDALFDTIFPYSMGWHGAPTDDADCSAWQLHAHFYPPLLRSATVRKFIVGYEMLAEPQRDITAEAAAAQLRGLPR